MKITTQTVDELSRLAHLSLSGEEKAAMAAQLEEVVGYMEVLNRLDTDGVEPVSYVFPVKNVIRQDKAAPSEDRAELLKNAPAADGGMFLVPKTVE